LLIKSIVALFSFPRKHAHELHIYVVGEPSRGENSSKANFDKLLRRLRQTLESILPLIGSRNWTEEDFNEGFRVRGEKRYGNSKAEGVGRVNGVENRKEEDLGLEFLMNIYGNV
jgi:hypothetical protein